MELLKLSKFKLQLRTLIAEVRDLRERERSANEQLHLLDQNRKHTEDQYCRKLQELETEFASSNDLRQKLERKVSSLQNENALLESRQNELKGTINSLLQSRESFINAYEESSYKAKRSIEARDKKLTVLSEKIDSFSALFESIEKEALYVKRVVDNVQNLVSEKEGVVAGLRSKMDQVSAFKTLFIEKISELENKLKKDEEEFFRKNKIISELEAQLEVAAISNKHQTQIQKLQKMLSTKNEIIENLISERRALHSDKQSLEIILQKIQSNFASLDGEKRIFSLMLEDHDRCNLLNAEENSRIKDEVPDLTGKSPNKAWETASPRGQECTSVSSSLQENNCTGSNALESVLEPSQLAAQSISVKGEKENGIVLPHQLDTECSSTHAEISQAPVKVSFMKKWNQYSMASESKLVGQSRDRSELPSSCDC